MFSALLTLHKGFEYSIILYAHTWLNNHRFCYVNFFFSTVKNTYAHTIVKPTVSAPGLGSKMIIHQNSNPNYIIMYSP